VFTNYSISVLVMSKPCPYRKFFDERKRDHDCVDECLESLHSGFNCRKFSRASVYVTKDLVKTYSDVKRPANWLEGIGFIRKSKKDEFVVVYFVEFESFDIDPVVTFCKIPKTHDRPYYWMQDAVMESTSLPLFLKQYEPRKIERPFLVFFRGISAADKKYIVYKLHHAPKTKKKKIKKVRSDDDSGDSSDSDGLSGLDPEDYEIAAGSCETGEEHAESSKTSKHAESKKSGQEDAGSKKLEFTEEQITSFNQKLASFPTPFYCNLKTCAAFMVLQFGAKNSLDAVSKYVEGEKKGERTHKAEWFPFKFKPGEWVYVFRNPEACLCLTGYMCPKREYFQPGGCLYEPLFQPVTYETLEKCKTAQTKDLDHAFQTHCVPLHKPIPTEDGVFVIQVGKIRPKFLLSDDKTEEKFFIGVDVETLPGVIAGQIEEYKVKCLKEKFTESELEAIACMSQRQLIEFMSDLFKWALICVEHDNRPLGSVLLKNLGAESDELTRPKEDKAAEQAMDAVIRESQKTDMYASEDPVRHDRQRNFFRTCCLSCLEVNPLSGMIRPVQELDKEVVAFPEDEKQPRVKRSRRKKKKQEFDGSLLPNEIALESDLWTEFGDRVPLCVPRKKRERRTCTYYDPLDPVAVEEVRRLWSDFHVSLVTTKVEPPVSSSPKLWLVCQALVCLSAKVQEGNHEDNFLHTTCSFGFTRRRRPGGRYSGGNPLLDPLVLRVRHRSRTRSYR